MMYVFTWCLRKELKTRQEDENSQNTTTSLKTKNKNKLIYLIEINHERHTYHNQWIRPYCTQMMHYIIPATIVHVTNNIAEI